MYITVSMYRAKAGQDDAIIALHEDWQRHHRSRTRGYLSGELLRKVEDPYEFIAIMRFDSLESAHALTTDPEQKAWHQRVASLTEHTPISIGYAREWQAF